VHSAQLIMCTATAFYNEIKAYALRLSVAGCGRLGIQDGGCHTARLNLSLSRWTCELYSGAWRNRRRMRQAPPHGATL